MYYIAYGSNLNMAQMAHRCPDAIPVGTAMLRDWRLVFRTHATIEPCRKVPMSWVPVVVWEISERDEQALDRYEGYPRYYDKRELDIDMRPLYNGEKVVPVKAMVYIMTKGPEIFAPSDAYYETIYEGYRRFGLGVVPLRRALKESLEV